MVRLTDHGTPAPLSRPRPVHQYIPKNDDAAYSHLITAIATKTEPTPIIICNALGFLLSSVFLVPSEPEIPLFCASAWSPLDGLAAAASAHSTANASTKHKSATNATTRTSLRESIRTPFLALHEYCTPTRTQSAMAGIVVRASRLHGGVALPRDRVRRRLACTVGSRSRATACGGGGLHGGVALPRDRAAVVAAGLGTKA